jgi:signal transduction histidine kinase
VGSAPPLAADAERLESVFLHLLVNSAQAMRVEGRIQVSIGVAAVPAAWRVPTRGPGIPPAIREKIFTPLFSLPSRAAPAPVSDGQNGSSRRITAPFRLTVRREEAPP